MTQSHDGSQDGPRDTSQDSLQDGSQDLAAGAPGDGDENGVAPAGLVLGTEGEASTPLSFWTYVDPGGFLQLDDVVHVRSPLADGRAVDVYGVVDEVRATQEGASFTSDVALVSEGVLPAQTAVSAHVSVTRTEPEILVPPTPGQPVRRAHGAARDRALYFDSMKETFAIGLSRGGEPMLGNLEFVDGRRGAHVNISGVSGVATKTSYATFLVYSLLEGGGLGARATNAHALIFNVKGEDLLFVDKENALLDDESRKRYAVLGLPVRPFGSVNLYAPARPGDTALPDTGSRSEGVTGFFWTLREFCANGYLRFLFADAEDERSQLWPLVSAVERQLRTAVGGRAGGAATFPIGDVEVASFGDLVRAITDQVQDGGFWAGSAATGTVGAFLRRLEAAEPHVGPLLRAERDTDAEPHRVDWTKRQLTVVALNSLHDRAQRFVVGVLLRTLLERREQQGIAPGAAPVFVVLDELNKYAPRDGHSPIKEVLLDIAERGRSLGVILIGAQQTASEVEQRVVANCAFRVVGRLDAAESQRSEYGFLTQAARSRAGLLKPGTMIVHQPEIPVPLLVQFPFPAWATRAAEVRETTDAFARFDA